MQAELQDTDLHLFSILGEGGFGTVYRGATARPAAPLHLPPRSRGRTPAAHCHAWGHITSQTPAYVVSSSVRCHARGAGEWRGLPVAVKTVVFQSRDAEVAKAAVVSEAAIACGLVHRNVVRTHHHDMLRVSAGRGPEQSIFKFILLQVRPRSRREGCAARCRTLAHLWCGTTNRAPPLPVTPPRLVRCRRVRCVETAGGRHRCCHRWTHDGIGAMVV